MKCYRQKINLVKDTCELNNRASYLDCVEGFWLYGRVNIYVCVCVYIYIYTCIIYIYTEIQDDSLEYTFTLY